MLDPSPLLWDGFGTDPIGFCQKDPMRREAHEARANKHCPIHEHGVRSLARWHGCDDDGGVFRVAG